MAHRWNGPARAGVYHQRRMSILQDIRLAVRLQSRAPVPTAVAVLSVALSVGATAVVFPAIRNVVLEPLPYAQPHQLVQIRTEYAHAERQSAADWVSWNDMQDVARQNHSFESLGIYHYALFNLAGDRNVPPEALYGLSVSASLLPTLGVSPMLGRNIQPEENQPGRQREMILSYGLWARRFHSDPQVIGRSVQVNGHDCRIIGVMPPGFDFPMRLATSVRTPSEHMDFWAPLAVDPATSDRASTGFGAIARLRPEVSAAQAQQDLAALSATLEHDYPRTNRGRLMRLIALRERTLGFAHTGLWLLMAAALLFMLIGCANVANLLLARALARRREMAIRLALGAGRGRLIRQVVTESCVLATVGGLVGYLLTVLAWKLLPTVTPVSIPRLSAARADWMTLAFALAMSLLNGVLFGLAPAWRIAERNPAAAFRQAGTRGSSGGARNGLRSALVVAEVAVAVVLVVLGGLLTGSFVRLLASDPGFQADRVLASIIIPSGDQYRNTDLRRVLFQHILDATRRLPGVEAAGTVDALPFSGENNGGGIAVRESDLVEPSSQPIAEVDLVSAGYLPVMGVRLLAGEWFREEDTQAGHDTAIVNDFAARRFWPDASPLGKRICINCSADKPHQWKRVIGVVTSMRHSALDEPAGAQVYTAAGALENGAFLVARTNRPTGDLARAIRRAVAAIDPNQPVFLSATMGSLIADSVADRRFILTLLAAMGSLALLVSAGGVYGVISYTTSLRTQEIGVRVALGATPRNVQALIFRQGMSLAGIGLGIGLAAALGLKRILSHLLPGLETGSPAMVWTAASVVIAAAVIACWIPALRATRIDPTAALRQE